MALQDYNKAIEWYRKSAERGYAQSQTILGLMYSKGRGVERDYKEAVKWYRKAADQAYVKAQFNLGVMYSEGRGVEQSDKEAAKWCRKAAEGEHAPAQAMLKPPVSHPNLYRFWRCSTKPAYYPAAIFSADHREPSMPHPACRLQHNSSLSFL